MARIRCRKQFVQGLATLTLIVMQPYRFLCAQQKTSTSATGLPLIRYQSDLITTGSSSTRSWLTLMHLYALRPGMKTFSWPPACRRFVRLWNLSLYSSGRLTDSSSTSWTTRTRWFIAYHMENLVRDYGPDCGRRSRSLTWSPTSTSAFHPMRSEEQFSKGYITVDSDPSIGGYIRKYRGLALDNYLCYISLVAIEEKETCQSTCRISRLLQVQSLWHWPSVSYSMQTDAIFHGRMHKRNGSNMPELEGYWQSWQDHPASLGPQQEQKEAELGATVVTEAPGRYALGISPLGLKRLSLMRERIFAWPTSSSSSRWAWH